MTLSFIRILIAETQSLAGGKNKAQVVKSAYEVRGKNLKMTLRDQPTEGPRSTPRIVQVFFAGTRLLPSGVSVESVLKDREKLGRLQQIFQGAKRSPSDTGQVADSDIDNAEMLTQLIRKRLDGIIATRILHSRLLQHDSIKFFSECIETLAALAVNFRHIKNRNLGCATENTCLIWNRAPADVFAVVQEDSQVANLVGAYGYWYRNDAAFVRVGSAARGFHTRHREHDKCAALQKPSDRESKFYTKFPKEATTGNYHRGLFDELTQFMLAGFDATDESVTKMLYAVGGPKEVLPWNKYKNCTCSNVRTSAPGTIPFPKSRSHWFATLLKHSTDYALAPTTTCPKVLASSEQGCTSVPDCTTN